MQPTCDEIQGVPLVFSGIKTHSTLLPSNNSINHFMVPSSDVCVAKKDIKIGEVLDGEGGFAARGRLFTAERSTKENLLPLGLSGSAVAKKNINKDDLIYMNDVEIKWNKEVLKAREYQKNLIING